MIIKNIVMTLFLVMAIVNLLLFLFILGKKIYMVRVDQKKEFLRNKFEYNLKDYMTHRDHNLLIILSTRFERKVFDELFLRHVPYLTAELKQVLISTIGSEQVVDGIKKKLMSKNPWVKKIGTFQAGEFGVKEVNAILLEQLNLKNRELLYVTVRALIKLGGSENLLDILNEVGKENRMEKNNVLILVEMVNQDIRDVLEKVMLGSNTMLQILALEIYGKRQYFEGAKWIKLMVANPLKEIRIAALKGAYDLGDILDEDYFNKIAALEKDDEWEVRAFLAKFLENIKTNEAITILARLIKDSNWYVRNNAAIALVNQGESGLKSLVGLLDSKDRFARDKSREVIQTGIIYEDLLYKLDIETYRGTLMPELETGTLKVNKNYE